MSNILVSSKKLTKHFAINAKQTVHAVDAVSLDIVENTITGLVGESGSGKSTFGKTLLGLYDKTDGEVTYKGELLPQKYASQDFRRNASRMQMIFQDPYSSLNPRMTIFEIIGEPLRLQQPGISMDNVRDKVAQWLEKVGLNAEHMSRYPHEFSGGQRQRIGIARALIVEPEFVVCDEPISALDVSVQAQVINLLSELKQSLGLTLLFIAHDLSMVRYVSDRMAVMYLGSIIEEGPANQVFFHPQHPYTQLLVGSNPEADPERERQRKEPIISGEIPSPINIQPGCRFAGRCPQVMDKCRSEDPQFITVAADHKVACRLFDPQIK